VDVLGFLSLSFSFFLLYGEQVCEGTRAFLWRKKGIIVPFLHCALISSIDQPKNIGDIGLVVFVISLSIYS
jgi:hypothetical protein